jgi:hypothetical protein
MDVINTREEWLEKAVDFFRGRFLSAGRPLPNKVRVSIGFPPRRGLSTRKKVLGCAFKPESAEDNIVQIYINPTIDAPVDDPWGVLAVLLHELVHASGIFGHKSDFKRIAGLVGLEGKATSTFASEATCMAFTEIVAELGEFPHCTLVPLSGEDKKDGVRMLKVICPGDDCKYNFRITKKWAEMGLPQCPLCRSQLELESIYANPGENN